jgi:hypothetical protein
VQLWVETLGEITKRYRECPANVQSDPLAGGTITVKTVDHCGTFLVHLEIFPKAFRSKVCIYQLEYETLTALETARQGNTEANGLCLKMLSKDKNPCTNMVFK